MAKNFGSKFKIENNILKGYERACQSDYTSLGKFVLDTLESSPEFVGQVDGVTGEEHTYEKMRERSIRCALWMRSQGLLPGDVVTICSHNQLDVAIACFATLYLGAAISSWDEELTTKDLRRLLNLTRPKIAFVSSKSITAVAEAAQEAGLDLIVVVFDRVPGSLVFESVIAEPRTESVKNYRCADMESSDQIALIMCSSGTTGLPKSVAFSHKAWLSKVSYWNKLDRTQNNTVVFSKISWISGMAFLFRSLASNNTRIVWPVLDEYSICTQIEKYKPKVVFLASGMVNRLMKSDALGKYDISSLTRVIYGGASMAVGFRKAFVKFVPKVLIFALYGITEVGGLISKQTSVNSKDRSCGKIIENTQLKVIDPNTGCTVGPNQRGELLIKSTYQMSFYYNDPNATAEAVDEEGWFHSGDFGYYDEEGEIFVLGRFKDLITCRGYRVSPFEIESVIWPHPGVKQVAVVGVPHPVDGEHPIAFVVRASDSNATGNQVTEMELVHLVAAELSDNKRLRGGVRFVDHLPTTASGKAIRWELRELAKSMARIGGDQQTDF